MGEMETIGNNGLRKTQKSGEKIVHSDAEIEIIETARRWSKDTSAADHKSVYGGIARDLGIALRLQDQRTASELAEVVIS